MSQDDEHRGIEMLNAVFEAGQFAVARDVAGHAHHEQITDAAIENQLHWSPRIGTGQDGSERFLAGGGAASPFRV